MSKRSNSDSEPESGSGACSSSGADSQKKCRREDSQLNSLDVLTKLVQDKSATIDRLTKEKRMLQQTVRRQQKKIVQLSEENQSLKSSASSNLDVARVADKTGHKGKSGSWLTPAGAVSLAVSCYLQ